MDWISWAVLALLMVFFIRFWTGLVNMLIIAACFLGAFTLALWVGNTYGFDALFIGIGALLVIGFIGWAVLSIAESRGKTFHDITGAIKHED